MSRELNDKEIFKLLSNAKSREEGFVALMTRYREPIYWHIRRLVVSHEDAQDVTQECFIRAYRHIDSFRGDSSLKTWLYRVATNEAIRHYRRKRLETQSYDEHNRLIAIFESDSQIDFVSAEAKLQKAILALPPTQRIVFNLRYYEQMEYQEIAEVTESSVASLKSSYHYATQKVKEYMLNNM